MVVLVLILETRCPVVGDVWVRVKQLLEDPSIRSSTIFYKAAWCYSSFCRMARVMRTPFDLAWVSRLSRGVWVLNESWLLAWEDSFDMPQFYLSTEHILLNYGHTRETNVYANRDRGLYLNWMQQIWKTLSSFDANYLLDDALWYVFDAMFGGPLSNNAVMVVFCIVHMALSITLQVTGRRINDVTWFTIREARDSGFLMKFKFWSRIVALSIRGRFKLHFYKTRQEYTDREMVHVDIRFRNAKHVEDISQSLYRTLNLHL